MKNSIAIWLLLAANITIAQPVNRDSLQYILKNTTENTTKVDLLQQIGDSYMFLENDSASYYANLGFQLATDINYKQGQAICAALLSLSLSLNGDAANALEIGLRSLEYAQELSDSVFISRAHMNLMVAHSLLGNDSEVQFHGNKSLNFAESTKMPIWLKAVYTGLFGKRFYEQQQYDSALHYLNTSSELYQGWSGFYLLSGRVYLDLGSYQKALTYLRRGIPLAKSNFINTDIIDSYVQISRIYQIIGLPDSSIHYATIAQQEEAFQSFPIGKNNVYSQLADIYEEIGQSDSTIKYLKLASEIREDLLDRDKAKQAQSLIFNRQLREQEVEAQAQLDNERFRLYVSLLVIVFVILIAFLLYRSFIHQKRNNLKLDEAFKNLKSTQSQLIQSEKMASLGELTAGIAHEIQNPLNFVNNFSEVSKELIGEMKEEIEKGDINEVQEIAKDIDNNLEKINHHGQRASGIVKGMLEHSRAGDGVKELTDLNALADEYLRLAYHGLRAKDKSFNADFKTDFNEALPKVNVVPQDIGRVLLNLINNAFYAVNQKAARHSERSVESGAADSNYKPEIIVTTKLISKGQVEDIIEISVQDNGPGIPSEIKDKIFQPFFTTKPTGSGTGLGLSLSYDILKAHGGELMVESPPLGEVGKVGKGSEFIIQLQNV